MFPLVGFKSTSVYYERQEHMAGKSHYPLRKMLALAFDGITSLSVKPIQMITNFGMLIVNYRIYRSYGLLLAGHLEIRFQTQASMICVICFIGGVPIVMYRCDWSVHWESFIMETKHRPRYIISDRTCKAKIWTTNSIILIWQ